MSERATVFVEEHPERVGVTWFHVRCRYPGARPHTLLSVPTRAEAVKAAHGYAKRYDWTLLEG